MKLIAQNIMNILSDKYGELKIDDVVNSIEKNKNAKYDAEELINTLKESEIFKADITSEKVLNALKSKTIKPEQVINTIAKTTYLTQENVRDVLMALENFIMSYCNSNYSAEGITISIPYLGKLITKKKKGRKAGIYKVAEGKIGKGKLKDMVLEKDEPNYLRFSFDLKPSYQETLKANSIKRGLD